MRCRSDIISWWNTRIAGARAVEEILGRLLSLRERAPFVLVNATGDELPDRLIKLVREL